MTNDKIALQALLEKTSDASMLRDMISFAAERSDGVGNRAAVLAPPPASAAPSGSTSATDIATATGTRFERGHLSSCAFPKLSPWQRYFPAASSNRGAWPKRLLTRRHPGGLHPRHLDPLGRRSGQMRSGWTASAWSQVSRLCGEIDGRVHAFLDRPIEGDWPYVPAGSTPPTSKSAAITRSSPSR